MKRHRTLTIAGAGSALAATLVISATLFPTLIPGNTVQASTIIAGLRDAIHNGFEITLRNIGDDGVVVNGHIIVAFDSQRQGLSINNAQDVSGVYFEIDVAGDESAQDMAGLSVAVHGAVAPEQEWLYLKVNALPAEIVDEEPMALFVENLTRDGLLLNLEGILEREEAREILSGLHEAMSEIHKAEAEVREKLADGTVGEEEQAEAEMVLLFMNLITGDATAADLQELVTALESHVGQATIHHEGGGLYVLTLNGFEDDEDLADATIDIGYQADAGVQWVSVDNLGAYKGSVRFNMKEVTLDVAATERQRIENDGVTKVLDLSALVGMFETMGQH